jgi:diguanylate cyclase (GGDEF)-like protein/PAS domain S-box-containing protein
MNIHQLDQIKLLGLLERAEIGIVIHTIDTAVIYANPAALKYLRLSYEQIIGKDALDPKWKFINENYETLPIDEYPVYRVLNNNQPIQNLVMGVVDSEQEDISWFCINGYFEGNKDSNTGFVIITFNDITDKKSRFHFSEIVHNAQDIVIVTEADDIDRPFGPRIVYVNQSFEKLTGYRSDEVIGKTPRILQGEGTDKEALQRIRVALQQKIPCTETVMNYSKHGKPYWLEINIIPLTNRFNQVTHFAAIERDVSDTRYYQAAITQRNKELEELKNHLEQRITERTLELRIANARLFRLAHEDVMTGLPNRKSFFDQAAQQIARAYRGNIMVGVAVVDIDHFKKINDKFGHDIGDQALCKVAEILKQQLREEDVIGRIGGEEFAICLLAVNEKTIVQLLSRLKESISNKCEGLAFAPLTVSIGMCCSQGINAPELKVLLKSADVALYEAKRLGRDQVQVQRHLIT